MLHTFSISSNKSKLQLIQTSAKFIPVQKVSLVGQVLDFY